MDEIQLERESDGCFGKLELQIIHWNCTRRCYQFSCWLYYSRGKCSGEKSSSGSLYWCLEGLKVTHWLSRVSLDRVDCCDVENIRSFKVFVSCSLLFLFNKFHVFASLLCLRPRASSSFRFFFIIPPPHRYRREIFSSNFLRAFNVRLTTVEFFFCSVLIHLKFLVFFALVHLVNRKKIAKFFLGSSEHRANNIQNSKAYTKLSFFVRLSKKGRAKGGREESEIMYNFIFHWTSPVDSLLTHSAALCVLSIKKKKTHSNSSSAELHEPSTRNYQQVTNHS